MTYDPAQAPVQTAPPAAPAKQGNGLAVAGFVVGLVGLLGSFIPLINVVGIVLGVIGAVLAAVGFAKARKTGNGNGLAMSGIILGGLAIVIGIVINVAFVNAVDDAVDDALDEVTGTSVSPAADDATQGADDGTDEGTDEAPTAEAGATRDNPAPLGSVITGGDWDVVINSVSTVESDKYGQTAAEGNVLLVVNMTATYTGDDEQGDTAWAGVEFVTAEGNTIDSLDGSTLFVPENQFDSLGTVFPGASVTGDQILEVPADWTGGVLSVTPELLRDAVFVAVQ